VLGTSSALLGLNRPTTGSNVNNITGVTYNHGNWDINSMIDALAEDGFVTVLAEPNLTAMSGETASFLAGGEFPIPVPQGQGAVTIMFRQYGISLAFTPTLIGEDRINLHVKPEVSQLTSDGSITIDSIVVPGLSTRRAETTIELGSGQSFAIAGLLSHNQQQTVDKYPFLGDMPILGQLFRSSQFQNDQSELVIIITPYIVKPSTEEQLALPTDGFSPPSDADRLINNRFSNSDPNVRPLSGLPRAVRVDPADEAAAPQAAPLAPVSQATPSAPAAPAKVSPLDQNAPAGPGGFILE
jgi:pilus assembly protein CpaC